MLVAPGATKRDWSFLDQVPAELLPANPMGLVITYLQADRALAFE